MSYSITEEYTFFLALEHFVNYVHFYSTSFLNLNCTFVKGYGPPNQLLLGHLVRAEFSESELHYTHSMSYSRRIYSSTHCALMMTVLWFF